MVQRKSAPPRDRLSREALVTHALSIVDSEGLEAVTIRRLAKDVDVTPMALYWHFADKNRLFDGIAERLFSDVELPELSDDPWQQQIRTTLTALLAAMRPHPFAASLAVSRILKSESGLMLAERVLGLLRRAGFSSEQAAQVGQYLLCSIITLVTTEPGLDRTRSGPDSAAGSEIGLDGLSPERYPSVVESAPFFSFCTSEDSYFAVGIDLLVQGTSGIRPA